jgi:hypothetical protein
MQTDASNNANSSNSTNHSQQRAMDLGAMADECCGKCSSCLPSEPSQHTHTSNGNDYIQMTDNTNTPPQPMAMERQQAPVWPAHWVIHKDPSSGRDYYFNKRTGESVWQKPPEVTEYERLQQSNSVQVQNPTNNSSSEISGSRPQFDPRKFCVQCKTSTFCPQSIHKCHPGSGFPMNAPAEAIVASQWKNTLKASSGDEVENVCFQLPYRLIHRATGGWSENQEIGDGGTCRVKQL